MRETLVLTRHAIRNYGSVLQAYATRVLISQAGGTSRFIDYRQAGVNDTSRGYVSSPVGGKAQIRALAFQVARAREAPLRGALFEDFIQNNLTLTDEKFASFEELVSSTSFGNATTYCVGSDQVWNVEYNVDNRPYYLGFVPPLAKRFSLASSLGMERLPRAEEERLLESLRSFAGVSVREAETATYLAALGIDAVHHVDPTLAIEPATWSDFAGARRSNERYVLVYQLNANRALEEAAQKIGKMHNIPVRRIEYWRNLRGRGDTRVTRPSVQEFVRLIRDAAFVVTDSFHGSAFSVSFNRPFVAMSPPRYGGRIESLLSLVGASHRRVGAVSAALDVAQLSPDYDLDVLVRARRDVAAYVRRMII